MAAPATIEDANTAVVERFFAAMTAGDADGLLGLLAEDLEYWVAGDFPLAGTYTKAQFEENLRGTNPEFERPKFTGPMQMRITGTTAQGDRVAVEAEASAGLADGGEFRNLYHYLMVIRDGRIVQWRQYMDTKLTADTFCREDLRRR